MSKYAKPSENSVSSTTSSSIPSQQILPRDSIINTDSKQSVISSSTDNKIPSAQQRQQQQYQIEFNDQSIVEVASLENNKNNLNRAAFNEDFDDSCRRLNEESPNNDNNSWNLITPNKSTILRDCSDSPSHETTTATTTLYQHSISNELKQASDSRLNIPPQQPISNDNHNDSLINIDDNNKRFLKSVVPPRSSASTSNANSKLVVANNPIRQPPTRTETPRARFESLLASDTVVVDANERELDTIGVGGGGGTSSLYLCDSSVSGQEQVQRTRLIESSTKYINGADHDDDESPSEEVNLDEEDYDDTTQQLGKRYRKQSSSSRYNSDHLVDRSKSPSYFKRIQRSFSRRLFDRFSNILIDSTELDPRGNSEHPYTRYEDKDLLTGTSKYTASGSSRRSRKLSAGRTFRGTYKYSRTKISMAIFKRLFSLLVQRSTLSLFGAFLIHVTLGTVYTLSNINSYLTSYMRQHGSPNATYGGSMWISSSYAVGQGFSMVLGGYIEKRFSARVACLIGCALHSISIMSTSWSIDYGPLAVLLTYGFMPGFGCGLAYMTPMSNGFGWFPNRKGLVAGVILAGFGIGTFVFNITQTAYVNPENLSPPEDANGYFTQPAILDKVPHLFVFIGTIYASMQFVGCCLLFKPPNSHASGKSLDERPILVETEMPLRSSIRRKEFIVLFFVYGITTQGVLFVNSMIKEYGQIFIGNDMYLAWTGSMASIANSVGRLAWGLAIDRFSFTQCFTSITIIFASLMFLMPFEFILSSKLLYLLCTLGLFGSFSGWMSTYPVHLSRVFGRTNSGMIYGLIFISQSLGGILTALGAHYLIDHYSRFVPFFCVVLLEILGLSIYHLFYPK